MIGALEGGRAMSLTARKLHPRCGAEIVGVDVESVDDATSKAMLLFRGRSLTDEDAARGRAQLELV
jgi:hypothetical protein